MIVVDGLTLKDKQTTSAVPVGMADEIYFMCEKVLNLFNAFR